MSGTNQFASTKTLLEMIHHQKNNLPVGVFSICSANRFVLEAAMRFALDKNEPLLIEATCNQVNQFGGYTGMTPQDFADYVLSIAEEIGFPPKNIILGGDHLGPNPWKDEPAASAMKKAEDMLTAFVSAGFKKIHLDASMRCGDDPQDKALDPLVSAQRAAQLCLTAEKAGRSFADNYKSVYVVGTEVPVPGGAQADEMELSVTTVQDAQESIQTFYDQFKKLGLEEAWQRVIALVVQPGVEFDHAHIIEYDRQKAASLSAFIKAQAGLVFEAHSTDYQLPIKLKQLVEDQFAILKVGPGLTFALREALFALAEIENIWLQQVSGLQKSDLMNIIEQVMLENPKEWRPYYHGTETEQAFARKYSYSDRIRYYWNDPTITKAVDTLIDNLESAPPPLPLISQFLPIAYQHIREGKIKNQPKEIIWDHIQGVIQTYQQACKP